jgi:Zinc finger, C2H2 type
MISSYVTKTQHVQISVVECELASICLQYLTFRCFEKQVDSKELENYIFKGYLAFQDYAVSKWFQHLIALAREFDMSCFNGNEHEDDLVTVGGAMEDFLSLHEDEVLAEGSPDQVRDDCQKLSHLSFHENLVSILSHVTSHLEKGADSRNEVCPKALGQALVRNREAIEKVHSRSDLSQEQRSILNKYYGMRIFKCPKVTCPDFFEGFLDPKSRDRHFNGHRRPWVCEEPYCTYGDFGFISGRDLDRHMRDFHPDKCDFSAVFMSPPAKVPSTTIKCEICHKKFSRKFHLNNHTKAHNGERPYSCAECGKSFTRANDCKRHEKTIHSRRLR